MAFRFVWVVLYLNMLFHRDAVYNSISLLLDQVLEYNIVLFFSFFRTSVPLDFTFVSVFMWTKKRELSQYFHSWALTLTNYIVLDAIFLELSPGGGQLWGGAASDLQNKMEEALQQRETAAAGALHKKSFI